MRLLTLFAGLLTTLLVLAPASWAMSQPALEIVFGDQTVTLSRGEVLERADLTEVQVSRDATYKQPMSYRALPLASLLRGLPVKPGEVIEVVATDGFVTQLPADLVFAKDGTASVPYLAIEPADKPWPVIPGRTVSAGPFYVVWLRPEASGVRSEQWPYAVASFRSAESPVHRWPAVAVDAELPANSPIRAGQALFITQMHGLPHAQPRRERPCRPRSQHPAESNRVSEPSGVAPADPRSGFSQNLAGHENARV